MPASAPGWRPGLAWGAPAEQLMDKGFRGHHALAAERAACVQRPQASAVRASLQRVCMRASQEVTAGQDALHSGDHAPRHSLAILVNATALSSRPPAREGRLYRPACASPLGGECAQVQHQCQQDQCEGPVRTCTSSNLRLTPPCPSGAGEKGSCPFLEAWAMKGMNSPTLMSGLKLGTPCSSCCMGKGSGPPWTPNSCRRGMLPAGRGR